MHRIVWPQSYIVKILQVIPHYTHMADILHHLFIVFPMPSTLVFNKIVHINQILKSKQQIYFYASSSRAIARPSWGKHIIKHWIKIEILFYTPTRLLTKHTKLPNVLPNISAQHQDLRNCLHKHCYLLREDAILNKYVRDISEIVFRKTTSIGNRIIASQYDPNRNSTMRICGISICGQCTYCPWVGTSTRFSLPNGDTFCPSFNPSCETQEWCTSCLAGAGCSILEKHLPSLDK